jgi:hypothetical protein
VPAGPVEVVPVDVASPVVASHHDEVVWVGGGGGPGEAGDAAGSTPADGAAGVSLASVLGASAATSSRRPDRICSARRARAWYSGPCFRGSAYSFGLIVQYVPDVVPYQDAPPQSGENAPGSTSSYEVEPSVAFFRRRSPG